MKHQFPGVQASLVLENFNTSVNPVVKKSGFPWDFLQERKL